MNKNVNLEFLGGTETVTGSKTVLRTPSDSVVMVDCGLFQGIKERRRRNWNPLPVSADAIDHVLLTHGHLDHVGYLPRLVRIGFEGVIHATEPTLEVAKVILQDSAKIQEEDAERSNREGYTEHDPAKPLYTVEDAKKTVEYFRSEPPNETIDLAHDAHVTFRPNGHILGSTFLELSVGGIHFVFSGDLGRPESILHEAPEVPAEHDYLILESTYGDRLHLDRDPKDELEDVVHDTIEKKGNLIVPSFTLARAQELMFLLAQLKDEDRIPNCPTFLDSPMGVNITDLYQRYDSWHKLSNDQCRLMTANVELISDFDRTRTVLDGDETKIIIAGSGMLTGGRVLYYLKRLIGDPSTTILFTGYQAQGTRGRSLQRGAHELKFHGKYHPVRAEIRDLTNLSAHADQEEIIEWLQSFPAPPERVFLNHGEPQASQALRVKISDECGWDVETVNSESRYSLVRSSNE